MNGSSNAVVTAMNLHEGREFILQKKRVSDAFVQYGDRILRVVFHLTGTQCEAEDCTQEAFMRLLLQPDSMENDHIYPWLVRTALNIAKDLHRSIARHPTVSLDEIRNMAEKPLQRHEESALYAVMQLPEKYRVPLYLHLVEGYSIVEVAQILAINLNTVSSRIRRAKHKLRQQLGKQYDSEQKG